VKRKVFNCRCQSSGKTDSGKLPEDVQVEDVERDPTNPSSTFSGKELNRA
jgi:hypothetical protein